MLPRTWVRPPRPTPSAAPPCPLGLSLPSISETELTGAFSRMAKQISSAEQAFRASGHVENVPMECAVDKYLSPGIKAIVIFVIYLLENQGLGKESPLHKQFIKLAKGGGNHSSHIEDAESKRSGSSRGGGFTDNQWAQTGQWMTRGTTQFTAEKFDHALSPCWVRL